MLQNDKKWQKLLLRFEIVDDCNQQCQSSNSRESVGNNKRKKSAWKRRKETWKVVLT